VLAAMAGGGTLMGSVSESHTTRPARSAARVAEATMSSSRMSAEAATITSGRSARHAPGVGGSRAIAGFVSRPLGAVGGSSSSARQPAPTRAGRGNRTTAGSTPLAPVSGQSAAQGAGGGAPGQGGARAGNVNAGQPSGQTTTDGGGGNGNGGQPPGQTKPRAGGGNGNSGQPPGQTVAPAAPGPPTQPSTNTPVANGNSGQPPGQAGGSGNGNGNGGQPPGQTGGGNGNGGSHQPPGRG
jgi:hypothetical protein